MNRRVFFGSGVGAVAISWGLLTGSGWGQEATLTAPQTSAARSQVANKTTGQRVFFCGHSFHQFVAKPVALLAREAGLTDHTIAGEQYLGGSRPLWHWNLPDEKNKLKAALATGKVDVVTLSPHVEIPDAGIDNYANLAFEYNPQVRVMLQLSWAPRDWQLTPGFKNEDRDAVTRSDLDDRLRKTGREYFERMKAQAVALNTKHGREFVQIVPCGEAVLRLREAVVDGNVPGVKRQSELFRDPLGHAQQPLQDLVAYCWFAAIYGRNPEGMKALVKPGDDVSQRQQRLLQQIAWSTISDESAK